MKISHFEKLLGLVAFVILSVALVSGQTTTATVTGSVSDQSGAAIPSATVVVENLQTHVESKAQTNSAGFYRVAGLIPGYYRATVTKAGFRSVVRDSVELHGQDEVALNYVLQVGSVTESVTVTGSQPLLQSESATVSTVIESQQIQNTPLNGRNAMNLAALTPGVVPQGATNGNPLNNQAAIGNYTNPAGWDNYQIGGAVTGENLVYVDGGPLNLPTNNWMGFIPTQDSIQEFRVETNNISSEWGGYFGGVLNFTTKSGTNEVHGSAYEYFRNTVLDANNFFNNRTNVKRPPVQQNQFGVSLGGPIKKNKAFLFGAWERYVNRTGLPYQTVVPTAAETTGDFTADPPIYNFLGQQISCNGVLNKVCPDPTALYMASGYKYWAAPNIPNVPHGGINFSTNASSGGESNQYVFRGDYSLNRHQIFARYTLWKTHTLGTNYYHNNVPQPEILSTTQQAVVGDTITLNSTTIADVRASYLRFLFTSQPPFMNHIDLSKFGPAYAAIAGQATFNTLPVPFLAGYGNQFPILIINVIQFYNYNKYDIAGNLTKTFGRNALKFGGELMQNQGYLAGGGLGPTGIFLFVSGFPTTDIFANFMMGQFVPSGLTNITTSRNTSSINVAQGYYIRDVYQLNPRLTLTGGLRWELPGGIIEKHDVNTVFLPDIPSPLGTINNPATGTSQALKGNLALVNSPAYPSRFDDNRHMHLFAPNLGFSWRAITDTVVRGGFGMSFISYTNGGIPSPYFAPITQSVTPSPAGATLSNPWPQINGKLPQPLGRDPNFAAGIQGLSVSGTVPGLAHSNNPYVMQWNLNIQRQLSSNSVVQIGYQGSKGTHLNLGRNLNQISDAYASQAATQYQNLYNSNIAAGQNPAQAATNADSNTFLNVQVPNPMAGKLSPGSSNNGPTISQGQLLKAFPQFYNSVTESNLHLGYSVYHSLQATYQLRFRNAGAFYAAYTWAKLIGTVDSHTGFLEGNTVGGVQNGNNLHAEKSLESFDVPQRLVLNYSLGLPVGKGQRWLSNANGAMDRVVGGWRLSSVTSFQTGYPLALTAQANDLSNNFGAGTIRPNRVSGCQAKIGGSVKSRLKEYFNTDCFVQPPTPFSYGNESRVDSQLRGHGVNNWDISIGKLTNITERVKMNFEAQFLNTFNRTQFGPPGLQFSPKLPNGTTTTNFGVVSSTLNNPRQIQFSGRIQF